MLMCILLMIKLILLYPWQDFEWHRFSVLPKNSNIFLFWLLCYCYSTDRRMHQDTNLPGIFNCEILGATDPLCEPLKSMVWGSYLATYISLRNIFKIATRSSPILLLNHMHKSELWNGFFSRSTKCEQWLALFTLDKRIKHWVLLVENIKYFCAATPGHCR